MTTKILIKLCTMYLTVTFLQKAAVDISVMFIFFICVFFTNGAIWLFHQANVLVFNEYFWQNVVEINYYSLSIMFAKQVRKVNSWNLVPKRKLSRSTIYIITGLHTIHSTRPEDCFSTYNIICIKCYSRNLHFIFECLY